MNPILILVGILYVISVVYLYRKGKDFEMNAKEDDR